MSSEEKTIHINVDALKIPDTNKTRKNKKETKIRVKNTKKKEARPSTLKRNILNIIRNSQRLKEKENKYAPIVETESNEKPKSSFEESVTFLNALNNGIKKNETLKKTVPNNVQTVVNSIPISPENPNQIINYTPPIKYTQTPIPSYGCLKNGSLPTYKVWKNQTQKNYPNNNVRPQIVKSIMDDVKDTSNYKTELENKIKEISEIDQINELKKQENNIVTDKRKKPKRQKRIVRRTFKVGKSKVLPKVSVLISNKTLRNKANLHKQSLRETSIKDVKKHLLKNGFIKVGTTTPNDVLREMFESSKLICGDVKNNNPDNLLYNYFNDDQI